MKWEIVTGPAGTHARFADDADNTVWTTKVHPDPKVAEEAIDLICSPEGQVADVVWTDLRSKS